MLPMKTLKITNLLAKYYDDFTREFNTYYLDKETGEIIIIDSMLYNQWESGEEIKKADLPQWQQEDFETIIAALNDYGKRYEAIPSVDPGETNDIMRQFVGTVKNQKIADELYDTLHGPKSFRRFRAVLKSYDQVRNQYYDFKNKCYLESLEEWLEDIGIKPEWID